MKINNCDARSYVQFRLPFEGSNLYALKRAYGDEEVYIVFSYGQHWPLFVYTNGTWFENQDRRSITTSKHRSQTHPHCDTVPLPVELMRHLAERGYSATVKDPLTRGELA